MDNIEQTIPFVVLLAVGALLLVLVRRTSTLNDALVSPSPEIEPEDERPETLPLPANVTAAPTLAVESPTITLNGRRKPRKKREAASKPAEATPIETVVGLLKQKNTLAAAFLLREIFAPPVSRR